MKNLFYILSAAIFWSCNGGKNDAASNANEAAATASGMSDGATESQEVATGTNKYDLKSGIITFETVMSLDGSDIRSKKVLYFDDYGRKECEETYRPDASGKEALVERNF